MPNTWTTPSEPPLAEMIADPIVRLVMRRDRIGPEEVMEAVDRASHALARRRRRAPGAWTSPIRPS